MEHSKEVIRNASRRMKIMNKQWTKTGYNVEYNSIIKIYERGYIVGMYNQSASPQFSHIKAMTYGGLGSGEHIVSCILPHQLIKLTVEEIIEMVNRELDLVKSVNSNANQK